MLIPIQWCSVVHKPHTLNNMLYDYKMDSFAHGNIYIANNKSGLTLLYWNLYNEILYKIETKQVWTKVYSQNANYIC